MLLDIYRAMMRASTPLLEAYLKKREARGKEDPARAPERRGAPARPRGAGPLVWFHAASVGESLALLSLISRLLHDYPGCSVMVTTGTVTSARLMADRLPPGAFHQYMPVDHPAWVARFLDHWTPSFVIWSESEFWPNMLVEIAARGIPAALLNARMSKTSFRRWRLAKGSMRKILSAFTLCFAQNDAEAARLKALGAGEVRVSANLKYGAPPLPFDDGKLAVLKTAVKDRPLVLFASTHPGEEEIAAQTHLALKGKFRNLLTIVVPRHPARGTEIGQVAREARLNTALRSAGTLPGPETELYIADTLGELGLFYRLCKTVVVGGSFADIGGHNPIEPGQLGCAILYGPVMYNFVTISDDFLKSASAVQVKDAEALADALRRALEDPAAFAVYGANAREMTAEKAHVVDDLADALRPLLAPVLTLKAAS
jgi:3-deoxy-D-manno-octulosonic-acid transferase